MRERTALLDRPVPADREREVTVSARGSSSAPAKAAGDRILTWRWPWLYEVLFRLSPSSRRLRDREIDAVLAAIDALGRPRQTVVEVGCGPGTYTRHLASRFARVTALDASRGMIDRTRRRMQREGHRNVVSAYGALPADLRLAAAADGVVAIGVLDFADDLALWLNALRACVAPGGWVVCTVPCARTAPRMAGVVEGVLAGRVFTRESDEVHAAAADAGLPEVRMATVGLGGRAYTMVVSAIVP